MTSFNVLREVLANFKVYIQQNYLSKFHVGKNKFSNKQNLCFTRFSLKDNLNIYFCQKKRDYQMRVLRHKKKEELRQWLICLLISLGSYNKLQQSANLMFGKEN